MNDATPTRNLAAERAVLGALISRKDALYVALEQLQPGSFADANHAEVFRIVQDLTTRGLQVGWFAVMGELDRLAQATGRNDLLGTLDAIRDSRIVQWDSALRDVRECAVKRGLEELALYIARDIADPLRTADESLGSVESRLSQVASGSQISRAYTWDESAAEFRGYLADLGERANVSGVTGVPSGIGELDRMTTGFQPGDLVILAGRPSMGKTGAGLSFARNAAKGGVVVAIFSLEMTRPQLKMRIISAEARVSLQSLRSGLLTPYESEQVQKALARELPILIDDGADLTPISLRAKALQLKGRHNIGLIVIDYLQLMTSPTAARESREREVAHISKELKKLAKDLQVPVIALSQLNRSVENRAERKPQLSDLRESGSIEQDADTVLFCHRPEYYGITIDEQNRSTEGRGWLLMPKQRQGPTGEVVCQFEKSYASWSDEAERYTPGPEGW